jgi:hypothetical protein
METEESEQEPQAPVLPLKDLSGYQPLGWYGLGPDGLEWHPWVPEEH